MAHFAQLDNNNVVVWVTVVDNRDMVDENGIEQEELGIQHILNTLPGSENFTWKQTSYNANFRGMFASKDCIYDDVLDEFFIRKPYPSWILNREKRIWESPIPIPNDTNEYDWIEETLEWKIRPNKPDDENNYSWDPVNENWILID